MSKKQPVIIVAGTGCGGVWYVTPDRRVWALNTSSRALVAEAPVPGDAPIVAFDLGSPTAILEGGERFAWLGGRWHRLANLSDASAMVRIRFLSGTTLAPPRGDVYPGDELELPEAEARAHIARRIAEAVL